MIPELLYFTDPYCIWCFGFSPSIGMISNEYRGRVVTRVVNGGMVPDDVKLSAFFGRFPDPVALHERVTLASGREFGEAYLSEIRNYGSSVRILNSTTPSRAAATFKSLGVSDEVALAGAIQDLIYIDGEDAQKIESYRSVAERFHVDFDVFISKFPSLAVGQAITEDRKLVASLGVQGFPALILKTSDRRYVMAARGYMAPGNLKITLDEILRRHLSEPMDEAVGQACSIAGGNC